MQLFTQFMKSQLNAVFNKTFKLLSNQKNLFIINLTNTCLIFYYYYSIIKAIKWDSANLANNIEKKMKNRKFIFDVLV